MIKASKQKPRLAEAEAESIAFYFGNRQGFRYSLIQELKLFVRCTGVFYSSFPTSFPGSISARDGTDSSRFTIV